MADSKITALTSIGTSTDPSLDQMVIVDTSDGSMAATGTTKKVSLNQLLSSNPSATGGLTLSGALAAGSATITGDLTVRTTGLTVNSSGVGVGTSSQSSFLGNSPKKLVIGDGTQTPALTLYGGTANVSGIYYAKGTVGNEAYRGFIEYNHAVDALTVGISGSTAMTLNSTGLGVGVTPSGSGGCLQLKSGITFPATQVASSDANTLDDYEEGVWTPTGSSGVNCTSISVVAARYTKIGRIVTLSGNVTASVTVANTLTYISLTALPFNNAAIVSGPCFENNIIAVGFSSVESNNAYLFFPATSALTTGSKSFFFEVTYHV